MKGGWEKRIGGKERRGQVSFEPKPSSLAPVGLGHCCWKMWYSIE